jgi:anti-sigma B factor antagonist
VPSLHHSRADAAARQQEGQMPQSFDIQVTSEPTGLVVRVSGELDLSARAVLVDEVTKRMAAPDVTWLAIDVGQVTFCDSSGLGALLDIRRASGDAGIEMVLRNVPPPVARLLDLTDVDAWLTRE